MLSNFLSRSWLPIVLIASCLLAAAFAWAFGAAALKAINPEILQLEVDEGPGGLHGADLVANLLTISALTLSVCVAYICLPKDRVEVRICTYVKITLAENLIEEKNFFDYYLSLKEEDVTRSLKVIRGFLSPRVGLGGWHEAENEDLRSVLGPVEYKKLDRFVNNHVDEEWVILVLAGIGIGVIGGIVDLSLRYIGVSRMYFNSYEFSVIVFLFFVNALASGVLVSFAFGGHTGERAVRHRIRNCVEEIKGRVAAHVAASMGTALQTMDTKATSRGGRRKPNPT